MNWIGQLLILLFTLIPAPEYDPPTPECPPMAGEWILNWYGTDCRCNMRADGSWCETYNSEVYSGKWKWNSQGRLVVSESSTTGYPYNWNINPPRTRTLKLVDKSHLRDRDKNISIRRVK